MFVAVNISTNINSLRFKKYIIYEIYRTRKIKGPRENKESPNLSTNFFTFMSFVA